jgi:glycosyltransferase involved in cell wall biosynthesis
LSRIRILRVITRLNLGGPAQDASLLSGRRLDPERFETLLVHGRLATGEESMADLAEREGARMKFLGSLVQPVSPTSDARALARLIQIARPFRPHIVHTHTAKAGFLGRLAALAVRPRPAIVHTYHGHVLEGYFGPLNSALYRFLERRMGRVSSSLIGVSQATVDDLVRLEVAPPQKFRVIPLGADLQPFAQGTGDDAAGRLRHELGVSDDEVLLLFVGRLVPIKRVDVLLRSMWRASGDGLALRLAVVGDGPLRPELERLSDELGLRGAVQFLGYRRDLPRIAAGADLAVLSSDKEGTPVSLIEAAAAGRPAIATAVGGVPEIVTAETGVLVPAGDENGFGLALKRLGGRPDLRQRMGEQAREHALGRYSGERLVAQVQDLYEELLSDR